MSARVRILYIGDTHGQIEPYTEWRGPAAGRRIGGVGGLTRLLDNLRAEADRPVLLLHAGDAWCDTALQDATLGADMVNRLNRWGVDALTLGNHDYDYGVARLPELAALASFPFLAANLTWRGEGSPAWMQEPLLLSRDGLQIAVIGLTYHNTPQMVTPEKIAGLYFGNPFPALEQAVHKVRETADLVIALNHSGTAVDRILGQRVRGIDLIIGGHSHDVIPYEQIDSTHYGQAGSHGGYVGVMDLRRAREGWQVDDARIHPVLPLPEAGDGHPAPGAPEPLVVGEAAEQVPRYYAQASPLDQWMAEVIRETVPVDICFLPGRNFGVPLEPGPVTCEALARYFPHNSDIWTCTLSGAEVRAVLERSLWVLHNPDPLLQVGGLIQCGGLYWEYTRSGAYWERVLQVRLRQAFSGRDEPLQEGRRYRVAINGLLARNGQRQQSFIPSVDLRSTGIPIRDLLCRELARFGPVWRLPPNAVNLPR